MQIPTYVVLVMVRRHNGVRQSLIHHITTILTPHQLIPLCQHVFHTWVIHPSMNQQWNLYEMVWVVRNKSQISPLPIFESHFIIFKNKRKSSIGCCKPGQIASKICIMGMAGIPVIIGQLGQGWPGIKQQQAITNKRLAQPAWNNSQISLQIHFTVLK